MAKSITKIMFDNDGVNIDSEDVAMRVMDDWGSALVRRYVPAADLPQDYIYKTYPGTSTDRIVDALIRKFDLPVDKIHEDYGVENGADVSVALADLITIETNNRFQTDLKAIPGVSKALAQVRDTFGGDNVCMATTSRADRMDVSLACAVDPVTGENAGLSDLFPAGELRRSGYGHDNKYVEAFGATGWDPSETAVVEDSLSGVTKAKASSPDVRVIGTIAAKFYEDKLGQAKSLLDAGASLVISTMSDLPDALQWLGKGLEASAKPDFKGKIYTADSQDFITAPRASVQAASILPPSIR